MVMCENELEKLSGSQRPAAADAVVAAVQYAVNCEPCGEDENSLLHARRGQADGQKWVDSRYPMVQ